MSNYYQDYLAEQTRNMDSDTACALIYLFLEIKRAREKFPSNEDLLPALTEEVGELSQALIQQKHEPIKGIKNCDVFDEAIQTACVAIRIATEGEPNFPLYKPKEAME